MQTDDIAAWLTAIWDEQEKAAREALALVAATVSSPEFAEPFEAHHDLSYGTWAFHVPAELVLARIAADRQILALHHPDRPLENWYWLDRVCAECGHRWHKWLPDKLPTEIGPEQGCPTVRLLALPHADRPGYQEDWRPARLP